MAADNWIAAAHSSVPILIAVQFGCLYSCGRTINLIFEPRQSDFPARSASEFDSEPIGPPSRVQLLHPAVDLAAADAQPFTIPRAMHVFLIPIPADERSRSTSTPTPRAASSCGRQSSLPPDNHRQASRCGGCSTLACIRSRRADSRLTDWELGCRGARPGLVRASPPSRTTQHSRCRHGVRFTGFEWLDDDRDPDARIWELYSAIHATAPGPLSEWSSRGRELKTSADTPDVSPPPPPPPSYRPSIRCNRALQWKTVDDLAGSGRNELLLLPGDAGQDHDHFIQRVQYLLRADPPRRIERVDWPSRPCSREEYQEALARAMRVEAPRLSAALGERLASKNIVLLHPCVRSGFLDEALTTTHQMDAGAGYGRKNG